MAVTTPQWDLYRRERQGLYLEHPTRPWGAGDPLESFDLIGGQAESWYRRRQQRFRLGGAARWEPASQGTSFVRRAPVERDPDEFGAVIASDVAYDDIHKQMGWADACVRHKFGAVARAASASHG